VSENVPFVRGLRGERGQTSAEYIGLLLVVAAAMVAVSASGVADAVRAKVDEAIAAIATDGGLGGAREESGGATGEPSDAARAGAQPAGYRPHLSEARMAAARGSGVMAIVPAADRTDARTTGAPAPVQARVPSPSQWWRGAREIARGFGKAWRWLRGSPKRPPARPPAKPPTPRSGAAPTVGQGLKNVRRIRSGRLAGYMRGDTELRGGVQRAQSVFRRQTGRNPTGPFDRQVVGNREVVFRATSGSGPPKIETIDHGARFLEKISFLP